MRDFKGKVVVITGAGSGIGEALALNFANLGAHLALNDFNKERLDAIESKCKDIGAEVFGLCFDVSNKDDFFGFAENVLKHYQGVDVVINNAGVALGKYSVLEASMEDFEWVFGINFWGVVYGTKAFLPALLKRSEASIVNISSLFGITGVAYQAPYCATKFAVRGFTESLRMEMLDTNVNVHVVHPGGIKTNIAKDSRGMDQDPETIKQFEKGFFHTPDKAAKTIINGIRKKHDRILIGPETHISDAIVRLAPVKYTNLIDRLVMKRLYKFD
ncbi:MAG: SDR family NAD(P)-dependent oxidoreductase [Bacteroidetes bacterium]|nr:SDR family NAD(P)-dependent oxidoreductase [Bacteroidota bacterium]